MIDLDHRSRPWQDGHMLRRIFREPASYLFAIALCLAAWAECGASTRGACQCTHTPAK